MSRPPPIAAYTQEYDSSRNPCHSDYWDYFELRLLNTACYTTVVQFPLLLTQYWIMLYLKLLINTPTDGTTTPDNLRHLCFRLGHIEYYTRVHANALRRYVLLTQVGILDPAQLANEYQTFLEQDPAPIWPWPQTPHPDNPHRRQHPEI